MRYLLLVLIAGVAFAHSAVACPSCFPKDGQKVVVEEEGAETVITGAITDADGNAVQNALVVIQVVRDVQPQQCEGCDKCGGSCKPMVRRATPAFRLIARTNAEGKFELKTRNLPEGKFELRVQAPGYESVRQEISLSGGEKNELKAITLKAADAPACKPCVRPAQ